MSVRLDALYIDIDVLYVHTGQALNMIAYLADDRAADGGNIHAVLDCNVQVDVDTAVHSLGVFVPTNAA